MMTIKRCLIEEHNVSQGASRRTCRAATTTSTAKRLPSGHPDRLPWQWAPDLPSAEVRRHGRLPQGGDQQLKQYFTFFWMVIKMQRSTYKSERSSSSVTNYQRWQLSQRHGTSGIVRDRSRSVRTAAYLIVHQVSTVSRSGKLWNW